MSREWRHLKLLKRSGRGHKPAGVLSTEEGACAVLCPACPHPGKNLPSDWDKAPKYHRQVIDMFSTVSIADIFLPLAVGYTDFSW
jgi:hypothetical protein